MGATEPGADAPLLIVNADDYGLTDGVSRAIITGHRDGIVTSTSVLAVGPAIESTAPWLTEHPGLGLGAHLAVVGEDPPVLTAREVPTLVDRTGRFALSWKQFLPRCALRRVDPDDLRREFTAQLDRLDQLIGLDRFDHVDTHQNIHLWPMVRSVVLELGEARGITAVRITRSAERSPVGFTVQALGSRLDRQALRRGWRTPDATAGLDEAGSLTLPTLERAVDRLASAVRAGAARSAELATHPGERDDPDLVRYRWGYHWDEELEALTSSRARDAVRAGGFRLGRFADLDEIGAAA